MILYLPGPEDLSALYALCVGRGGEPVLAEVLRLVDLEGALRDELLRAPGVVAHPRPVPGVYLGGECDNFFASVDQGFVKNPSF